ncbi:hypothetical protein MA16_Dca028848 [Dendrobium catenatum]|uniref:Uncharacterized protein n=1 Tax=Dendrobium catenatum TaxID=906689 RepID=A0A2I0V836_9ASPA|nr:hypothetical protein MA16_Dca028848 [Dendrobium catenatum]
MSALSSRHFCRDRIASVWSVVARADDRNWTPMTEGGVRGRVRCRTELVAGFENKVLWVQTDEVEGKGLGCGFHLLSMSMRGVRVSRFLRCANRSRGPSQQEIGEKP